VDVADDGPLQVIATLLQAGRGCWIVMDARHTESHAQF
jgi:hypothetical protein